MADLVASGLQLLDPEKAHRLSIQALKWGAYPRMRPDIYPSLAIDLMGLHFPNPFAIAAGFDKDGEVMTACHKMGLGFAEIGSVTPQPQEGNARPRIFRLEEQKAVINRCGFNSRGMDAVALRLSSWKKTGILGINLGKNRGTDQAGDDYLKAIGKLASFADYIVINISSPNTPGLRKEQSAERLAPLLSVVQASLDGLPLVLKVAPDLTEEEIEDIGYLAQENRLAAVMISNTTISRPFDEGKCNAAGSLMKQEGGLSGPPLFRLSTRVLRSFALVLKGRVPLIGVGGVDSAEAAYSKIRNGASLIQLYTALSYQGPGLLGRLNRDLAGLLKRDGFDYLSQAVGVDV